MEFRACRPNISEDAGRRHRAGRSAWKYQWIYGAWEKVEYPHFMNSQATKTDITLEPILKTRDHISEGVIPKFPTINPAGASVTQC